MQSEGTRARKGMQLSCDTPTGYYIHDMWLLLFIAVPAVELALLIRVGGEIGLLATVMIIVATGVAGWSLLKLQGLQTLARIRQEMAQGQMPATEMVAGLVLLGSGLFLLTPGFLTDTVGFLMLVPTIRRAVARRLIQRYQGRIVRPGEFRGPFSL
jgi:UPF0716 protein FxsA